MSEEARTRRREHRGDARDSDPSNVLLLAPDRGEPAADVCSDLLSGDGSDEVAALRIEFGRRSTDVASAWRGDATRRPVAFKVVTVGGSLARDDRDHGPPPGDVAFERVDHRGDLVLVGIEVAETLRGWQLDHDRVTLCVDSLTALVESVGLDRAYRLLRVLTEDVGRSAVRAHYHLDPDRHEPRTTYLFDTLTDEIVVAGDVEWPRTSR